MSIIGEELSDDMLHCWCSAGPSDYHTGGQPEPEEDVGPPSAPLVPRGPVRPPIPEIAKGHGVICGRFMHPHRGHQYLIDVARSYAKHLTVVVVAQRNDSVETRVSILREAFPASNVTIKSCTAHQLTGADASSQQKRQELFGDTIDYYFASDDSHEQRFLVEKRFIPETKTKTRFVLVDPERTTFPTAATKLSGDIVKYYDDLLPAARPYYARRVAICGPESSGKSTLTATLAKAYNTIFVPERARTITQTQAHDLTLDNIDDVARGQIASEDALARQANRVLFCDTNLRAIELWSERLFDQSPNWLPIAAANHRYDLVLIASPDVPFVGEAKHDRPAERARFFENTVERERAVIGQEEVVVLKGSWEARERDAKAAVDAMLAKRYEMSKRFVYYTRR